MGKKQACEKNTSSRWLYKHHTRKILLIFPSLPFLTLPTSRWGCAAAREFFRYFTALFPLRNLPGCTVLYRRNRPYFDCQKVRQQRLPLLPLLLYIVLYRIALHCFAPGKNNVFYTIIFSATAERPTSS